MLWWLLTTAWAAPALTAKADAVASEWPGAQVAVCGPLETSGAWVLDVWAYDLLRLVLRDASVQGLDPADPRYDEAFDAWRPGRYRASLALPQPWASKDGWLIAVRTEQAARIEVPVCLTSDLYVTSGDVTFNSLRRGGYFRDARGGGGDASWTVTAGRKSTVLQTGELTPGAPGPALPVEADAGCLVRAMPGDVWLGLWARPDGHREYVRTPPPAAPSHGLGAAPATRVLPTRLEAWALPKPSDTADAETFEEAWLYGPSWGTYDGHYLEDSAVEAWDMLHSGAAEVVVHALFDDRRVFLFRAPEAAWTALSPDGAAEVPLVRHQTVSAQTAKQFGVQGEVLPDGSVRTTFPSKWRAKRLGDWIALSEDAGALDLLEAGESAWWTDPTLKAVYHRPAANTVDRIGHASRIEARGDLWVVLLDGVDPEAL